MTLVVIRLGEKLYNRDEDSEGISCKHSWDVGVEEKEAAKYMISLYKLDRDSLNCERRKFYNDLLDDEFYEGLLKQKLDSRRIVFRSVFTYYKRRIEYGK